MSDADPDPTCDDRDPCCPPMPRGLMADASEISALRSYLKRRVRDAADVDDMVQDVYLRVLSAPAPGRIENARGFLRRIASNLLIDGHRRRAVRMAEFHVSFDEQAIDDRAIEPDRIVGGRHELARLGDALESVGSVARDAFLLVRVEGLSHKAAAARLGITPKAVSHHVDRTLAKLAERLVVTAS